MSKAQVIVSHPRLSRSITLEIDRNLLTYAQSGNSPRAQAKIAIMVKDRYNAKYGKNVSWISWRDLTISETAESETRPQGCDCECRGCDDNTFHCHKEQKGCYM